MNPRALLNPAFLVAALVLFGAAAGFSTYLRVANIILIKRPIYPESGALLISVPAESASWRQYGADRRLDAEIEETLGTTNYIDRLYVEKPEITAARGETNPRWVHFHAAYYTGTIDPVPHIPDRCLVGAGLEAKRIGIMVPLKLDSARWRLVDDAPESMGGRLYSTRLSETYSRVPGGRVNLPVGVDRLELRVGEFVDMKGNSTYAGFFFITNGRAVASPFDVRAVAYDANARYAYYMKVEFQSRDVPSPEALAEIAASFLDEFLGELMLCVPDWVSVERGLYPPDNPRRPVSEPNQSP